MIQFQYIASDGLVVVQGDTVTNTTGYYANLIRADQKISQLGTDIEDAMLWDNKEVAVGAVEGGLVRHGTASGVDEDADAAFECGIPCACH